MATISAISRTANVVTVTTSAAHGLIANQGFSIAGVTDSANFPNFNGTILTQPSSTTFTYNSTGSNASSSGGTAVAAKEVVVLEIQTESSGRTSIRYLLWLTTTVPFPKPNIPSAWSGASAAENAALAAGTTIEIPRSQIFPVGVGAMTKAQVQSFMLADFTVEQADLAGKTQPGAFFGGFFDTAWSF